MDATPLPHGLGSPRLGSKATASAKPLDIVTAWPRCAQIAGGVFAGRRGSSFWGACPGLLAWWRRAQHHRDVPRHLPRGLERRSAAELLQLPGVGPSLADRILEYRRTSGGFRGVDDLRKIQGIGPTTLERLRPFVLVKPAVGEDVVEIAMQPSAASPKTAVNKVASLKEPIDINRAGLPELQKLPGIGPKLSQRIVDEREKRAFNSVDDLRRVPGIGPKTLEKIKPYVTVGVKM